MNNLQFSIYKKFLGTLFIICFLLFVYVIPTLAHGGVNDAELIIRMTNQGFEPKELTVTEGDEVLFINNDDVDRWPASNLHPTHGLYPEFDPLKEIAPGDSWKMTFQKIGTWRMHDHLIPQMTGTIVVQEDLEKTNEAAVESTVEKELTIWQKIMSFFSRLIGKA